MLKIGLTGGIGTGKSLVTSFLQEQGANVINADLLGHEAYLPGTVGFKQVVSEFGEDIVGKDGHVDRQKLGPIVFSDPSNMERLNAIMHPLIKDMIQTHQERMVNHRKHYLIVRKKMVNLVMQLLMKWKQERKMKVKKYHHQELGNHQQVVMVDICLVLLD